MAYSERLKKPISFSLFKRRVRGDLVMDDEYLHGEDISDSKWIFSLAEKGITRSSEFQLEDEAR